MDQLEVVSLDSLVSTEHSYRKFAALWSFSNAEKTLKKFEKEKNPYRGFELLRLFKCLLLQFMVVRAPYERVFSQQNKQVRYCGVAKNQFAAFMQAICFNLKPLLVINPPQLVLV